MTGTFSYLMAIGKDEAEVVVDDALSSLAAIAQVDDEIVLVLNGYEGAVNPDVFPCPVRMVSAEGAASPAYARNVGLAQCGKDLIAFCDADDVFLSNRRAVLADKFQNTDTDVVFTSMILIDNDGKELGVRTVSDGIIIERDFALRCPIFLPAAAVRRTAISYRKFNENLRYAEDFFLWSELFFIDKRKFTSVNEPTIKYRINRKKIKSKNSVSRMKADIFVRWFIFRRSTTLTKIFTVLGMAAVCFVRLMPHSVSVHIFERSMRDLPPQRSIIRM